jgi:hypothetical protein
MSPRMLTFPTRKAKIVPIVAYCLCGQFFDVVVKLEPGADVVEGLPDNCHRCGASIDCPSIIADCIDTAEFLVELGEVKMLTPSRQDGAA